MGNSGLPFVCLDVALEVRHLKWAVGALVTSELLVDHLDVALEVALCGHPGWAAGTCER